MKINWKLRFQNKATLMSIIVAIIALIYQILALIGIVPAVSQSQIIEAVSMVVNILVLLGIVVDPTTEGVSDSERAMNYKKPN